VNNLEIELSRERKTEQNLISGELVPIFENIVQES
jgi:hypothetical protein